MAYDLRRYDQRNGWMCVQIDPETGKVKIVVPEYLFEDTRADAIRRWEAFMGEPWQKARRKGEWRCIRVKVSLGWHPEHGKEADHGS